MHSKKIIIMAQLFISGSMAFLMTGFFGFLHMGFTAQWIAGWAQSFVIAWPVAFVLSAMVGPLGFKIATQLVAPKTGV